MTVTALIVAAGKGERLGGATPKQFLPIAGKPLLRWAVESLIHHPAIRAVRVVIGQGQAGKAEAALEGLNVGNLIEGGAERADSVRAGLASVDGDAVLVHDAARPFCPPDVVDRLLAPLEFFEGAAPVLPVGDTLARIGEQLDGPVDRSGLARVQTPQAFRLEALRQAYGAWNGPAPTDETTVLRAAGMRVAAVEGDPALDKITTTADFRRAEQWLAGHSDADVVLHAITDAVLGAAGLGDIGEHFPPSDPQWKGASSDRFLIHAIALVRAEGAILDHIDCTIIAEEPKVRPYRAAMRTRIAEIAGLAVGQVSIKATTTEGLGFTGRREGIAAQAVASLRLGV